MKNNKEHLPDRKIIFMTILFEWQYESALSFKTMMILVGVVSVLYSI